MGVIYVDINRLKANIDFTDKAIAYLEWKYKNVDVVVNKISKANTHKDSSQGYWAWDYILKDNRSSYKHLISELNAYRNKLLKTIRKYLEYRKYIVGDIVYKLD